MDSQAIADLVYHLGRIATGDGLVEGLTAAQWSALRYFAQANRFSRTPYGFTDNKKDRNPGLPDTHTVRG